MNGRDVLTVTHRHRTILGIRATVVSDRLYLRGHLTERTTDWYAQDRRGNVWYLGERTATLDTKGRTTSTEGSWQAGAHGARAGIYMPADPRPGDAGRQEYYKGHAEDQFKVLSLGASVTTPAASSRHALLTQETTRLEPGAVDHKLYVRGIGTVVEQSVRGGNERFVLTRRCRDQGAACVSASSAAAAAWALASHRTAVISAITAMRSRSSSGWKWSPSTRAA
jgi:hypothetical protein